jgi:hypothetical protein
VPLVALRVAEQGCTPNRSHTNLHVTYAVIQPRTDSAVRSLATVANMKSWATLMNTTLECGCFTVNDMIPKIGFKEQIALDELPEWFVELQGNESGYAIVHSFTRSGMRVLKIEENKFVVIQRYAPVRLLAYIVEVCDKSRADEHIGWDMRAEHDYEREQDMIRDAHEDREPEDYDEEW